MKKSQLKEVFLKNYTDTFGNISASCLAVKIDRGTYYDWCAKDEAFKKAVEECDESFLDFAESKLHKKISDGEWVPLKYFLENKAKKRGWSNTDAGMELSGAVKLEIVRKII